MQPIARSWARWMFLLLAGFWSFFCFGASIFMLAIWLFTDHEAGYRNETLFQFDPISLLVLIAAIRGFRWKNSKLLVQIVLGLAILGVLLKVLPMFREWNWELIALSVPAHFGLAAGVVMLQNARIGAVQTKTG